MRKIVIAAVLFLVILVSCGKIKTYTQPMLELSYGGQDDSLYNFDTGTFSSYGFSVADADNASFNIVGQPAPVVSSDRAYKGTKSLKLYCDFTGTLPYMGGIVKKTYSSTNFTGKKITAYIWVPKTAFLTNMPFGGSFYVKGGPSYQWYQSKWQNITLGTGSAEGVWSKIETAAAAMTLPNGSALITPGALADIKEFGIKLGQGGDPSPARHSQNYTGYVYIDSINIE